MIRAAVIVFATLLPGAVFAACTEDRLDLRGAFGTASFSIEVADDASERARGLMFREEMARSSGMLFVYEEPAYARFWMKDTPLPLDLLFLDSAGTVTRIHEDAVPFDLSTIDGGEGVQFVLEINAGMSRLLGIEEGAEMRHPSIGPAAAWPCSEP